MKTTTKRRTWFFQISFALMVCLCFLIQGINVYALEDNLSGTTQQNSNSIMSGDISADDQAIGNWISQRRGMTAENLATASQTLSPLTNIFGNIVGGIIVLVFAGVFIITALDLLYISFPPVRNILYKGGPAGGMGAQPMGGGMMGGYGHRGMGMMGGGMMGGGNPGMAAEQRPVQWISDEAIQCAAMLNNGGGAAAAPMGGGMMAGAMAMQQQASGANMSMKSVIGMYFKKRIVFMILLAICAIVLTSSVLLGTGVNLANWLTKILNSINNNIPQ